MCLTKYGEKKTVEKSTENSISAKTYHEYWALLNCVLDWNHVLGFY